MLGLPHPLPSSPVKGEVLGRRSVAIMPGQLVSLSPYIIFVFVRFSFVSRYNGCATGRNFSS